MKYSRILSSRWYGGLVPKNTNAIPKSCVFDHSSRARYSQLMFNHPIAKRQVNSRFNVHNVQSTNLISHLERNPLLQRRFFHRSEYSMDDKQDIKQGSGENINYSASLRRFFLRVHPDFFHNEPNQKRINEKSFQQLNDLLAWVSRFRKNKIEKPPTYQYDFEFYCRIDKKSADSTPTTKKILSKFKLGANNVSFRIESPQSVSIAVLSVDKCIIDLLKQSEIEIEEELLKNQDKIVEKLETNEDDLVDEEGKLKRANVPRENRNFSALREQMMVALQNQTYKANLEDLKVSNRFFTSIIDLPNVDNLIHSGMILFDNALDNGQKYQAVQNLKNSIEHMKYEKWSDIPLVFSTVYSLKKNRGMLTIPFNFSTGSFNSFLEEMFDKLVNLRESVSSSAELFEDIKDELKEELGINDVLFDNQLSILESLDIIKRFSDEITPKLLGTDNTSKIFKDLNISFGEGYEVTSDGTVHLDKKYTYSDIMEFLEFIGNTRLDKCRVLTRAREQMKQKLSTLKESIVKNLDIRYLDIENSLHDTPEIVQFLEELNKTTVTISRFDLQKYRIILKQDFPEDTPDVVLESYKLRETPEGIYISEKDGSIYLPFDFSGDELFAKLLRLEQKTKARHKNDPDSIEIEQIKNEFETISLYQKDIVSDIVRTKKLTELMNIVQSMEKKGDRSYVDWDWDSILAPLEANNDLNDIEDPSELSELIGDDKLFESMMTSSPFGNDKLEGEEEEEDDPEDTLEDDFMKEEFEEYFGGKNPLDVVDDDERVFYEKLLRGDDDKERELQKKEEERKILEEWEKHSLEVDEILKNTKSFKNVNKDLQINEQESADASNILGDVESESGGSITVENTSDSDETPKKFDIKMSKEMKKIFGIPEDLDSIGLEMLSKERIERNREIDQNLQRDTNGNEVETGLEERNTVDLYDKRKMLIIFIEGLNKLSFDLTKQLSQNPKDEQLLNRIREVERKKLEMEEAEVQMRQDVTPKFFEEVAIDRANEFNFDENLREIKEFIKSKSKLESEKRAILEKKYNLHVKKSEQSGRIPLTKQKIENTESENQGLSAVTSILNTTYGKVPNQELTVGDMFKDESLVQEMQNEIQNQIQKLENYKQMSVEEFFESNKKFVTDQFGEDVVQKSISDTSFGQTLKNQITQDIQSVLSDQGNTPVPMETFLFFIEWTTFIEQKK